MGTRGVELWATLRRSAQKAGRGKGLQTLSQPLPHFLFYVEQLTWERERSIPRERRYESDETRGSKVARTDYPKAEMKSLETNSGLATRSSFHLQ